MIQDSNDFKYSSVCTVRCRGFSCRTWRIYPLYNCTFSSKRSLSIGWLIYRCRTYSLVDQIHASTPDLLKVPCLVQISIDCYQSDSAPCSTLLDLMLKFQQSLISPTLLQPPLPIVFSYTKVPFLIRERRLSYRNCPTFHRSHLLSSLASSADDVPAAL